VCDAVLLFEPILCPPITNHAQTDQPRRYEPEHKDGPADNASQAVVDMSSHSIGFNQRVATEGHPYIYGKGVELFPA